MPLSPQTVSTQAVVPLPSGLPSNRYGRFLNDGRAFQVTDVMTPRPWANVMANGEYGLVLTHAGGGFSWLGNSQIFRLTRWEQDLVRDDDGRWLYIAEGETTWSSTLRPTPTPAELDEVTHGLGYTTFRRIVNGVESEHTVFVPAEGRCEVWIVTLRERSGCDRRLRVAPAVEWLLGSPGEQHREFFRLFVSLQASKDGVVAWKRPALVEHTRDEQEASFAAVLGVRGLGEGRWFTDKLDWLGRRGDQTQPKGLATNRAPITTGRWDDPVAAGVYDVVLPADGEVRFVVVLGAEPTPEAARAMLDKWDVPSADRALEEVREGYATRWGVLDLQTGDPVVDAMVNVWLPHQASVGRMVARSALYQQGGAYGFRDQLQDSLAFLDQEPDVTLAQIGVNAEAMYDDGGVRHWWHPGTSIFARSRHSDTCLWLAHAVLDWLDETDDLAALDRPYGFLSRETEAAGSKGSLLDHALRGVRRALDARSPRGLPLIGAGDWNDGLSHAGLDGKGESMWVGMFLFSILRRLAPVLRDLGDSSTAVEFEREAESLRVAVNAHGWDGEWYVAGTNDEGRPFGSSENAEGQIFLNPQTWAVITGIAPADRADRAMESVRRRLLKPYGALLLTPAYREVDPYIGYITRYAPGLRENGGVYSHAATWAVQALAMAGDADGALALFRGLCPPLRAAEDPDLYAAEPYVMPGNADGPDSPYESRGGWTWYTGSAAWMRRVALHWLCGVRSTRAGLVVDPRLPSCWPGVSLNRPFRGDSVRIEVSGSGPYRFELDGEEIGAGPLPATGEGRTRTLRLTGSGA